VTANKKPDSTTEVCMVVLHATYAKTHEQSTDNCSQQAPAERINIAKAV
jgi:hypothetical protein